MNTNPKQSAWKCATYQCKSIVRLDNDHKHTNKKCYTLKNACRRAKLQTKTTTQTKHPKKTHESMIHVNKSYEIHMKKYMKSISGIPEIVSSPNPRLPHNAQLPGVFWGNCFATIFIQVSFRGKIAFRWGKRWETYGEQLNIEWL